MRPDLVRRCQTPRQNWFLISPPQPNQAQAAPYRLHTQLPIWKTSNAPPSSASSNKSKATRPSPDACSASAAPHSTANSSATTSAEHRAPLPPATRCSNCARVERSLLPAAFDLELDFELVALTSRCFNSCIIHTSRYDSRNHYQNS